MDQRTIVPTTLLASSFFTALLVFGAFCCQASADTPATQPTTRPAVGNYWLLHLPGIAGTSRIDRDLIRGLRDAGFDAPTDTYDWTCNDAGVTALLARKRNDGQAQKIADLITKQFREDPTRHIMLTGHSGGCGLAVWALEKLPPDVKVDTVLLLAPALSPTYDLSPALARVTGRLFAFTSPNDIFALGAGTALVGTIDGKKCAAAGKVGFVKPTEPADDKQYEKLTPRPYDAAWVKYGNIGDHIGVMNPRFVSTILAPVLFPKLGCGSSPRPPIKGVIEDRLTGPEKP